MQFLTHRIAGAAAANHILITGATGNVGVVSAIYMTTRFGMAEGVTPNAAKLLGRPPITMRQFVEDHATVWR